MGSWSGHTLPGSFFIFFGIVWAIKTSKRYFTNTNRSPKVSCLSKIKWDIVEASIKILLATFGLLIEQFLPWEPKFHVIDPGTNEFSRANNWSHSTMYAFFTVSAIVDILVIKFPKVMPHCIHHICHALAFAIEGFLFYFHTHGREELDVRIHVLLVFAIWPTSLLLLLLCTVDNNGNMANAYTVAQKNIQPQKFPQNEAQDITYTTSLLMNEENSDTSSENSKVATDVNRNYKTSNNTTKNLKKTFTIQLCISAAIILQGTWFWQAAYVLYPPNGEPWNEESHKNIAFLTMFFTWHLLLALIVVGVIFVLFAILNRGKNTSQSRNYSSLQNTLP